MQPLAKTIFSKPQLIVLPRLQCRPVKMRATLSRPTRSLLFITFLSTLIAVTLQRPPPYHAPNCPFGSQLAGYGRVFLRCWYDPASAASYGGYRPYTKDYFWKNFTITDVTPNYPGPKKGERLPPPGNYATSRIQFADIFDKYIPKFYEIFGNLQPDYSLPTGGGFADGDCLTYEWESHYTATLLKPYG
jgi:hypothetical protein